MVFDPSKLLASIDVPADWVGLRIVKAQSTHRSVRDGHPEGNQRSHQQGAMVEVLVDGQIGYGASNALTPASLQAAAQAAYHQARATSPWKLHPFSTQQRPPAQGRYATATAKPFDALTPGEINELLTKICHTLKVSDQVVHTVAMLFTQVQETWFVSSSGSEIYQSFSQVATDYSATAQDGSRVQRRSDNGWAARCYQGGLEHFLSADLWARVQRIGEQAVELLGAQECPTETTTLVLAPDQMMLQIHESVGHPLEIDRILGDERNYAGGSFVRLADFGNLTYGSPLMNITFDPTVVGEFASYGFDDTGAPADRQYLIREGKLLRGLGGLESQGRAQVEGVACTRATSWNRPPIDRMANLNLEPGDRSLEAMIASIERGVYMESNCSWSIDDRRYKFQFGCEYGRLIENGRLTKTVRNPNYRGVTPQFWHSLTQVGDASTWQIYGTPMCGKGEPNQAITVGHGSPVCVFSDIEVFGGAA